MTGGVELVQRADQPGPEQALDVDRLAGLQELVEPLERLHVPATGRGRQPVRGQRPDHPVDVLDGHLPRWTTQQTQHPLEHPGVVFDGHRAEPAGGPRRQIRLHTRGLEHDRVRLDGRAQIERMPVPVAFDELRPKTLATATVDRLLHHAHVAQTSGESVRVSHALAGDGDTALGGAR